MDETKKTAPVVKVFSDTLPKPLIDSTLAIDGIINGGDAFTDYGIDDVTYKGYTLSTGISEDSEEWRIERITKVGNVLRTEYPNGTMNFEFAWSERDNYVYSR